MEEMFESLNVGMELKILMKNVMMELWIMVMAEHLIEKLKMDLNEITALLLFET